MKPSIEAATKMAQLLEVSLDWLVGITDVELGTNSFNRIQDIDKLNEKDKEPVFEFLDSLISNRKIKKHLSKVTQALHVRISGGLPAHKTRPCARQLSVICSRQIREEKYTTDF